MNGASSRRKGYVAEAKVVRWLRDHGWPYCERRPAGASGTDILGCLPFVIEVKDRANVTEAVRLGLEQAVAECAHPDLPVAIVKRRGHTNPADWYAVMRVEDWNRLARHWDMCTCGAAT